MHRSSIFHEYEFLWQIMQEVKSREHTFIDMVHKINSKSFTLRHENKRTFVKSSECSPYHDKCPTRFECRCKTSILIHFMDFSPSSNASTFFAKFKRRFVYPDYFFPIFYCLMFAFANKSQSLFSMSYTKVGFSNKYAISESNPSDMFLDGISMNSEGSL